MGNYVDLGAVSGYIIDPAYLIFERADGKTFLLCNGTSGGVDTTQESITISNGWITSPRAVIDTTSEDTITYTSNLTDLWAIAGVNNIEMKKEAATVTMGDYYMVTAKDETYGEFVIENEATELQIEGFTMATGETPTAGTYVMDAADGETTITVLLADVPAGATLPVTYRMTKEDAHSVTWTGVTGTAKGRLTRVTPLYSEDDEQSSVAAHIYDTFEKVKVTGVPGFDSSYKSESSSTIEFKSMAPKAANAVRRKLTIA